MNVSNVLEEMNTQTRVFVTFFVLVVLIVGIYLFSDWFSKTTGYVLGEDQKIAFAECLASKEAVFYETANCAECDAQQALFGVPAWDLIEKQACDAQTRCVGLASLPAWEIEGAFYYGFKEFSELDAISSCDIRPASDERVAA